MAEKIARVERIDDLAPGVMSLLCRMREPAELAFRAGQFLSLRIDDTGKVRRSYSIASPPTDPTRFELLVKKVPGGVGTAYFEALHPGDDIHFTGPMGFFTCDLAHAGDVVFAATGSGIAAALPMIEDALGRPPDVERGRILLFWGLRDEADIYYRARLEEAARSPRFARHVCLSRAGHSWTGLHGRITQHILEALPTLERPSFYLVGNGSMIRDLRQALVDRGVDRKKQIRVEVFYPAAEP